MGYSALMQEDEMAALSKLNHFKQQIHKKTSHYNGQVIQFYGDGCLITFNSASDAVAAAAALQIVFQEAPIVPVRIGIHSGEVLYKERNIFGDSVSKRLPKDYMSLRKINPLFGTISPLKQLQ